ncbi:MAG: hypothetical protein WBL67_16765 [Nitrososphaeraceae archaeon]|nr:hypothetical protein [Nitrososphaeraceae archaeon]
MTKRGGRMHLGSFKFEGQLVAAAIFLAGAKFAGKRDICGYRFTPPFFGFAWRQRRFGRCIYWALVSNQLYLDLASRHH